MPLKDLEERKQYQNEYRIKNKDKIYLQLKEWNKKNKERAKECAAIRRKRKIESNTKIVNNIKQECSICGYNKCITALDFHHTSGDKKYTINFLRKSQYRTDILLEELNKCIVVCSNCHRELHDKERKES